MDSSGIVQVGARRMNYSQVHLRHNQLPSLEKDLSFSRSRLRRATIQQSPLVSLSRLLRQ